MTARDTTPRADSPSLDPGLLGVGDRATLRWDSGDTDTPATMTPTLIEPYADVVRRGRGRIIRHERPTWHDVGASPSPSLTTEAIRSAAFDYALGGSLVAFEASRDAFAAGVEYARTARFVDGAA